MKRSLIQPILSALLLVSLVAVAPTWAEKTNDERTLEDLLPTDELSLERSQQWTVCTPSRIAAFSNRIHVKCVTPSPGGIYYFAAPVNDPAKAARFLSILTAAYVMGRDLDVLYDPDDLSGSSLGCATSDCRLIIAVGAR